MVSNGTHNLIWSWIVTILTQRRRTKICIISHFHEKRRQKWEQIRRLYSRFWSFFVFIHSFASSWLSGMNTRTLALWHHTTPSHNQIESFLRHRIFCSAHSTLVSRTYYAYAFHLLPPPHHIHCDKFCERPQNQKSIIGMHSCRARLYVPLFCRVVMNGKHKCSRIYVRHSIAVNCFRVIHIISNRTFFFF